MAAPATQMHPAYVQDRGSRHLDHEFPSPFVLTEREPITLVELRMRTLSGVIRSKPNWWSKVRDASIDTKWRQENVNQDRTIVDKLWGGDERFEHGDGEKKWPRDPITDAQLAYIFDQLEYEASRYDEATGIFVSPHHRIRRQGADCN